MDGKAYRDDLVVAVAALLTFARGVPHQLMQSWDDKRFLIEFEPVQSIGLSQLGAIWSEPHFEAYHPLHLMAYWLDVPWVGPNGPVIHAVNLILWIGALALVRRVMLAWGLSRVVALLATLAFGLHPVQIEAVTWATGRKEIVALALSCACILLHSRADSIWGRDAWLSRLAFVAAALAKTTVLPLPAVLLAHDVLVRKRSPKSALLGQLPSFVIAAGLGWLVVRIWADNEMIRPAPEGLGPIALVCATYTHHLTTALLPLHTSPVYAIHRTLADFSIFDLVGPLLIVAALVRGGAKLRFTAFAFAVLLTPVSNVWPLYFEVQDRYLSLPLLPLAFGMGALVDALSDGAFETRARITLGVVTIFYAVLSVAYQGAWSSDRALWEHASETHPESFYAWLKVGEIHRNAGELEEALEAFNAAIEREPTLRLGHAARFQTLALMDERDHDLTPSRAVQLSQRYVQLVDDHDALRTFGGDLMRMGYQRGVLAVLARSLDLQPLDPERLENAALIQLEQGNEWLSRFYVSRLGRPPLDPRLQRFTE